MKSNVTIIKESGKLLSRKRVSTDSNEIYESRLAREFFMTDVVDLAKRLLGKIIVRKINDVEVKARIVETEAYKGPEDKGCHAYNNKKTERTKYFWRDGGHLYVYSIHNCHCFNIVANDSDKPEAVLIRAIEPIEGIKKIQELRKETGVLAPSKIINLTNGPGKACAALNINKTHNSLDVTTSNEFFVIDDKDYKFEMGKSVRINIDYAEEYIYKPWRFFIKNNSFVSKAKLKHQYKEDDLKE